MSCRLIFTVACRARPTKFCSRRAVINVSSSILRSSRLPPPSIASRVLSTSGQNNPNGPPNMRSDNRAKEEGDGAGVNDNGEDEAESSKETSGIGGEGGDGEGRVPGVGRGPVTWGALALFALAGALLVGYYRTEKEKRESRVSSQVKSTGKPLLGGPFTLVDMHGKPVTDKDFHGSFVLLYFGFCHCPDICPSELVKVGMITKKLAEKLGAGVVNPVFISVDPDRDTLAQLRHYSKDFHPSIQYLTGTKDQVDKAAKAYRVYFSKTEEHDEDEPYLVDHSIVIYLLAPDGDFLDFFTQRTTITDCVDRISMQVEEFRKQNPSS